jgi:hypothetical protein
MIKRARLSGEESVSVFDDQRAATHVTVNPQVLHESIDGEVIAIDLASGTYYSLRGSAADIWQLLLDTGGATPGELVRELETRYDKGIGEHGPSVTRFLAQLEQEGLVMAEEPQEERGTAIRIAERNDSLPRSFEPPQLEKYTDMQDLVLLDPVHEVDQGGWPRAAGTAADGASA